MKSTHLTAAAFAFGAAAMLPATALANDPSTGCAAGKADSVSWHAWLPAPFTASAGALAERAALAAVAQDAAAVLPAGQRVSRAASEAAAGADL